MASGGRSPTLRRFGSDVVEVEVLNVQRSSQDRGERLHHSGFPPPLQVRLMVGAGFELLPEHHRVGLVNIGVGLYRKATRERPRVGQRVTRSFPFPGWQGNTALTVCGIENSLSSVRSEPSR